MHIAVHAPSNRLALLDETAVRLFDFSSGAPVEVASVPVARGDNLNACDAWVGVLTGTIAPAGASLKGATLQRFDWALAPLPSPSLGEVARHTLSPSHDGARVTLSDRSTGRITVYDAATGEVLGANGESIPSGPSFSPDGRWVFAAAADQGSGAVLLFDTTKVEGGTMAMTRLPRPVAKHPGLDDSPFFSVFSADGGLVALSSESWGGRGLCVYDTTTSKPLWSVTLAGSAEEPEEWFAFQAAFTSNGRLLLLAGPEGLLGFDVATGKKLGCVAWSRDARRGFALDEAGWRVWLPDATPTALAMPEAWRQG